MSKRRREPRWNDAARDPFAMFVAPERKEPPFEQWWEENGFRELHQLLLWRWDPIGVADDSFPYAETEYDGYARRIAELLHDGHGTDEIAQHLAGIALHSDGLDRVDGASRPDRSRARAGRPARALVRGVARLAPRVRRPRHPAAGTALR